LGGFYLMYCWQHGGWERVILGAGILYGVIFWLCWRLYHYAHTKTVWA
ncbi:MFS transporter, partial [Aliivibrio sifiae]